MAEFMLVAMDQVVNEAPRFRYMSGGQVKVPLVLKAGYGFTAGWAGQHTGSIYAMFMGVPGLKVVLPSTAADAKGLMATRDPRRQPGRLPPPLPADARARRGARRRVPRPVRRGGGPARGRRRHDRRDRLDRRQGARRPPRRSPAEGIEAEVIDPRTLAPLDTRDDPRVGREDRPARARRPGDAARVGASAVIAAEVAEHGFGSLKAPIKHVTALDATIPYSQPMEAYVLPDEDEDRRRRAAGARARRPSARVSGARRRARVATADGARAAAHDVADPLLRGAGRRSSSAPTRSTGSST